MRFFWRKIGPGFSIPWLFHAVLYFPLRAVFSLFFQMEVQGQKDLKRLKGPLVIACSHASWIDPFLVGVALPFRSKVFPIRYATLWKYYYFPIFLPLIWILGGFPVRKGVGLNKSLIVPLKILKKGGTVGIFPTGKRTRKWNKDFAPRPKRGAAFLAIKSNVPVLPVKIEGNIGMNFKGFLMRKYRIKVKIGKMFSFPALKLQEPGELNGPANYIMDKITRL